MARRPRVFNSGGVGRPIRSRPPASPRAGARTTRRPVRMNAADTPVERASDPYRVGRSRDWVSTGAGRGYVYATGHGEGGPASKRVIVGYGFWIFLLSDIVMFSAFFAAHAVLQTATAGGPSVRELFHGSRLGA